MSKTLPSIQVHRPASVEQSHSYSRFSARGAGHEEHHRFYASSARVRSASPGATADSQFTGLSTLPRLPQVEFSLGPIQERVIPPYNDLEDPHLVPYWARKEMLIHERAVQRRRLRRQQEVEQQRRAAGAAATGRLAHVYDVQQMQKVNELKLPDVMKFNLRCITCAPQYDGVGVGSSE